MKLGLIAVVSIAALSMNAGLAGAAPRIDRAEVTRPGVYSAKVTKKIADKTISTGNRNLVKKVHLVEITTLIHAKPDMFFGLEGTVFGAPNGMRVPVRIVWHYPHPGLVNPETHAAKLTDDYMDDVVIGREFQFFWELTQDWQIVPGVWTFEMWYKDRRLIKQEFTLTKG
jgi:Domain of unknown function (DUF3859)